jgi:cell division transport system permease protein
MDKPQKVRTTKFFNSNLTTTISISLVLFLVGLITILSLMANQMSSYVKENISFTIVLDNNISGPEIRNVIDLLKSAPYVKSTEYVSKERAVKELASELGEDPQDFLGYNPLLASIEVKTQAEYANTRSMINIENEIRGYSGVKDIIYQKNVIELVNNNIQKLSFFLLAVAVVMLFISVGLINNTIRLQLYSKRFTINTMKLVGATSWFIRKPFLGKSIVNGLAASFLSIISLGGLIYYVQTSHLTMLNLWDPQILGITAGAIIILGVVISFFSSLFAVGKYLRIKTNDLYYI